MGLTTMKPSRRTDPIDDTKTVVTSLLCIKCGNDLRGCSLEARCPTCLHPVYDSVYGGFLIDASPREPRRLLEMSNIVLYPAVFLGGLTVVMVLATLLPWRGFGDFVYREFDAVFFCAMLSPLVALVGAVVFTGRHSAAYYRAKYGSPVPVIVVCVVVVVAFVAIGIVVAQYGYYARSVVEVVFVTIPTTLFLRGFGGLMRRVPNKKLATLAGFAHFAAWSLGVGALLVRVLRPSTPSSRDLEGFVIALTLITTCGALGLGAGIIRLLVLARRTLRAINR